MTTNVGSSGTEAYEVTWKGSADPQDVRLRAALLDAQRRLAALHARLVPGDAVVKACDKCLRIADEEAPRARYVAWDCLHQFDEEALAALSDEARGARWCSMKGEAEEKLKAGWRQNAADCIAKMVPAGKSAPLDVLRELHSHLASAAQNKQHKLELFERESLPSIRAWLLLTLVLAMGSALFIFTAKEPAYLVSWASSLLLGIPAGALGGILSMSFSLGAADLSAKIPAMRLSKQVAFMRPLLGATVAIPVAVFVQGGLITLAKLEEPLPTLALCFLGGFSERWFLGFMERFEKGNK